MNTAHNRWRTGVPVTLLPFILIAALLHAQAPNQPATSQSKSAAAGQKMTVEGVIVKRDADSLTLRDARGSNIVVALIDSTRVKEKKSNPFRRSRNYALTQLLRGLSVEVTGRQNSGGQLVADEVKLKDNDLRLASSVETRVDPIETRLAEVETKLVQTEQNAQRLSGQVEEVSAVAKAARSAAKAAQDTGDAANAAAKDAAREGIEAARSTARAADARISSLDDFDVKSTTTVRFQLSSAVLSKEAKAQLDTLAGAAKNEKGFMIEVTGYASSEGDAAANERLSERRADAVVRYLTENCSIPLRRLVTPFGFGAKQPVADNSTLDGRKQNRRVEVKILVNKGLTGQIAK
ncbi:MAG: OmpA family protein [Acidobacteriia bacterium]|nr:OmpA family protein [Terriglobia bacterium]